jgi:O-antigen/teichoic acid export membrane protein
MGLMRQALRGSLIVASGNYLVYGVNIFVQLWLIRLLAPADYGFYAVVTVIVELSYVLLIPEFATACIYKMEDDSVFHTAVLMSVIWCAGMALLFLLISPLLTRWVNDQTLQFVLILLFAKAAFGVGAVYGAYLERDMRFGRVTAIRSLSKLVALCVGILLAQYGFGVQSLLAIDVISYLIAALFTFALSPLRVKWSLFSRGLAWFVLRKSFSQLQFRLSGVALYRSPVLLMEMLTGDKTLIGYIDRAMYLAMLTNAVASAFTTKIAFILFKKLSDNPEELKNNLDLLIWGLSRSLLPIMVVFIAYAEQVVLWLYGSQWLAVAHMLSGLAAFSTVLILYNVFNQVYMGVDRLGVITIIQWAMIIGVAVAAIITHKAGYSWSLFAYAWSGIFCASFVYLVTNSQIQVASSHTLRIILVPIAVGTVVGHILSLQPSLAVGFLVTIFGTILLLVNDRSAHGEILSRARRFVRSFAQGRI